MSIHQALIQLRAFARIDAFIVAAIWILGFVINISFPENPFGTWLLLSTPFVVVWCLIKFRNYALDGKISFRRALAYAIYTFFYASIIFAFAQFVYMRFINPDGCRSYFEHALDTALPIYQKAGYDNQLIKKARDAFSQLTEMQLCFIFMSNNLFWGLIQSVFIAVVCRKK